MIKKILWASLALVFVVCLAACQPVIKEGIDQPEATPTPTASPQPSPTQPQETPAPTEEQVLELESYLRENPEPLISLLGMEEAEYWQFGDAANSYGKDGIAIEWLNPEDNYDLYVVSARAEGNGDVSIFGVACGKTYEEVDELLLSSGWISRHAEENGAGYLKFEENASFSLEINFGESDHVITYWYWNNWPEGEDVAELEEQQQGNNDFGYTAYSSVLEQVSQEYKDSLGEYLRYHVFDMDQDGVKELIVLEGTCEADNMWNIYTIKDGEPVYVGEFSGFHSSLYVDEEQNLFNLMAQMGVENITQISLEDGEIVEKSILEKEYTSDEDFVYPSDTELPWAYITDHSLLGA